MVFSKVAGAGSAAMRSISARFSSIAVSSAGLMSATLNRPNGGTPPQGPDHGASSGFLVSVRLEAISELGLVGLAAQAHKASTAATGARRAAVRIMSLPTKTSSGWGCHNSLSLHDLPNEATNGRRRGHNPPTPRPHRAGW